MAVRAVLIAFEKSEETLRAIRDLPNLPDDLRARVAEEVLSLVDHGETDPQKITQAVLAKVLRELT